jgi:hypothetical protein
LIRAVDSRSRFQDVFAGPENGFVARQIRFVGVGPTTPIHEIESAAGVGAERLRYGNTG